jgi:hypothetical protein
MNVILYREEMMWLQRSRVSWLKEGDRNTKRIHQKAQWRSRKNRIKKLKMDSGQWCDDGEDMSDLTREFFRNLFTKDVTVDPELLMPLFEQRVTQDMNEMLCKEFTEEIGDALFQIGPLKAPGPDGSRRDSSKEIGA